MSTHDDRDDARVDAGGGDWTVVHRRRLSSADAHYGGGLVDGAHALELFGDVATELLVRHDGDEGLFRAYDTVEFLAPVQAGDFIEVRGRLTRIGRTSRGVELLCLVYARARPDVASSAADLLDEPLVAVRATGTLVVPVEAQRGQ